MIDHWFGKVLDTIDKNDLWDDTMVILCTDHGHYLGEKDIWGKPGVPQYEPLGHIPLYIAYPGIDSCEVDALSTNVDINATLCDLFDVTMQHDTHGVSLLPLLSGQQESVREWALGGIFGNWVQVYDGHRNMRVHPSMTASHCHFGPTAGRQCPSRESIRRGRCPMIVRCWILCRGLISR